MDFVGKSKRLSMSDEHIKWIKTGEQIVRHVSVDGNKYGGRKEIHRYYTQPNGQEKTAYVDMKNPYVVGMPIDQDGNVILCREFRPGPEEILLDLPAGSIHFNEDPIEGMKRELLEETGYKGEVEFINTTNVNPYSTQKRHTFLIRNCKKVAEQNLDHDEFIEVVTMPIKQFFNEYVITGRTTNGAAFMYCAHHLGLLTM